MAKKKKSVLISEEKVNALTAIASIKECSAEQIIDTLLSNYIMENMSLLVNEINKKKKKKNQV